MHPAHANTCTALHPRVHAYATAHTFSIASTSEILTEGTYSMVMTRGEVRSLFNVSVQMVVSMCMTRRGTGLSR